MDDTGWRPAGLTRAELSPWPARALAAVVALLVTAPVLAPGFVLLRDMVFVPRQDLDLDALGLGGTLPRAVPADSVMALVTAVVPGDLVQKAVLPATVFFAVLGAARLVPPAPDGRRGVAGLVAGLVYGWSPYLAERLLMGHWSLLVAFAALPWIALAALRVREGRPRALARLVLVVAAAALTPTGAVLAAGVVLALVGRRRLPAAGAAVLVLAMPWIVAGALHPGGAASDPGGVAAFAARAEGWGGPLLALLNTGGIWNAGAVPASRANVLLPVLTLALVALAVTGWAAGRPLRGPGGRLVVLGVGGLLLALAGTVPVLRDLLEVLVREVPGAGLLRDGQKWTAWWALPLAVGAGLGVRRVAERARGHGGAAAAGLVAAGALLLPVIALPDLVWGVGGRLEPVAYPADWQQVREVLADDDGPGDVVVLPFGAYRAFDWNDGRPQLDPAARWLPRATVTDDRLVVDGRPVEGEDVRARTVAAAVDDPAELVELGVGWVLVQRGTPGRPVPPEVTRLPLVVDGDDLALYRVPGARPGPMPSPGRVTAVVLVHACALGTIVGAVLSATTLPSTVTLRRHSPRKRVPE
ncbi:hypothetical protein [Blastococcus sp. PRF04-17]|uniref:hypothetical protein n=1 Tax=Blastococcus sp. PRF04-17 TaxID=2933797 RepID=UPI001FF52CC9|nr:hypothetical protein [Blastococcus sp. PRF04-17]UOY02193.1 hypothetical protein MVA48_02055 [Blastococcus sp. PRF04-17]